MNLTNSEYNVGTWNYYIVLSKNKLSPFDNVFIDTYCYYIFYIKKNFQIIQQILY